MKLFEDLNTFACHSSTKRTNTTLVFRILFLSTLEPLSEPLSYTRSSSTMSIIHEVIGPLLRGRVRAIVQVHAVLLPVATLWFGHVALRLRHPGDFRLAIQAARPADELAALAFPLVLVAVSTQVVQLEGDVALAATWDVGGAVVGEAHPEPLGLGFEVWMADELDCELRVVLEQGQQLVLLPEEVDVLDDEVRQDFAS